MSKSMPEQDRGIDESELPELLIARAPELLARLKTRIPRRHRRFVSAEDVLQEVWTTVFRGLDGFHPDGRPHAFDRWLSTIVDRKLSDALKLLQRKKRDIRRQLSNGRGMYHSSLGGVLDILASPDGTPSRDSSQKEAKSAMRTALDGLPEDQKRALTLRYIQGLPLSEIAEEMGRSRRAVAGLIHRGRLGVAAQMGPARDYFSDAPSEDSAG